MGEKIYGFDSEMKQKLENNIKAIEKEMKGGNTQMPRRDKIEDDFDDDDEDEDEYDDEELERPLAAKKEEVKEVKKEEKKESKEVQQPVQIIEREITLSLLNDKLNYLISLVQK